MSILVNKDSRIIVQGFTGKQGTFHATQMIEYGTQVVGGVTPGKGGGSHLDRPLFDTVADARAKTAANVSIIFVPPAYAADAVIEAFLAGIELVVCITEGIPVIDMMRVRAMQKDGNSILIGPNCPGIITPDECKIGIMPGDIHLKGKAGVISRSGTLTYEAVGQLTEVGIGESTCVGIGGDPISGLSFLDCVKLFEKDPETELLVMMGEIGGSREEEAAEYIRDHLKIPVIGFIAGQTAPPGRRMGHAGAIVSGGKGDAKSKMAFMESCGIHMVKTPSHIAEAVKKLT